MAGEEVRIDIRWQGPAVVEKTKAACHQALQDAANHVLAEANKTAPYREGDLIGSGDTDVPPGEQEASVFYDKIYAPRLHEHPEYHFSHGRRGKWLSLALKEQQGRVLRFFQDALARALGGND